MGYAIEGEFSPIHNIPGPLRYARNMCNLIDASDNYDDKLFWLGWWARYINIYMDSNFMKEDPNALLAFSCFNSRVFFNTKCLMS